MPVVKPFAALRYDPAIVNPERVMAPPYDVIDDPLREALYHRDPRNVVRLILAKGDDPYASAARDLAGWSAEGALARDPAPSIYLLEQEWTLPGGPRRRRNGFIAACMLEDFGGYCSPPRENPFRPEGGPAAPDESHRHDVQPDLHPLCRSRRPPRSDALAGPLGEAGHGTPPRRRRQPALGLRRRRRFPRRRRISEGEERTHRRRPSPVRDRPRLPERDAAEQSGSPRAPSPTTSSRCSSRTCTSRGWWCSRRTGCSTLGRPHPRFHQNQNGRRCLEEAARRRASGTGLRDCRIAHDDDGPCPSRAARAPVPLPPRRPPLRCLLCRRASSAPPAALVPPAPPATLVPPSPPVALVPPPPPAAPVPPAPPPPASPSRSSWRM